MFLNFKKNKKTGEPNPYDIIMGLQNDIAKLNSCLDGIPDEFKHIATSENFGNYIETLDNIFMSRFSWTSPFIHPNMLDNIEKFLLRHKACAILREKRSVNGVMVYSDFFGVYKFSVTKFDPSGEIPITINIENKYGVTTVSSYNYDEFVIIKDFSSWSKSNLNRRSVSQIIESYAAKLSLIDSVIDSNLYKHKLPLIVKGKIETNNTVKAYFKELYRNALYMFDGGGINNNFTIEAPLIEYIIDKLQSHKDSLLQEFCSMIGVSNSQNYSDVYQNTESVKLNNSFVYNVAQSHYINRMKVQNTPMADKLMLVLHQNDDLYGKVDLIKPDLESE